MSPSSKRNGVDTDRRRFVVKLGSLLLLLPAGRFVAACGSSGSSTTPAPPAPAPSATELTFTSSLVDGHDHTVQISTSDLAAPPANGETLTTSIVQSHSHMVELTEADLNAIEAGQTVTKDTTLALSHVHTFTFQKAAA